MMEFNRHALLASLAVAKSVGAGASRTVGP